MKIDRDIVRKTYQAKNFDDFLDDLVKEIELRNYPVKQIYHIDNIHKRSDQDIMQDVGFLHYKIVEFCNLDNCSRLISSDLQAGVFMPVRFIVYQLAEGKQIHLAFLKPTAFARLFNSEALTRAANELEHDMNDVLDELDF